MVIMVRWRERILVRGLGGDEGMEERDKRERESKRRRVGDVWRYY